MTVQKSASFGSLKTLDFSDLYLEPDGRAWFKNSPNDRQRHSIESDTGTAEIAELRRQLQEHRTGLDFRTEWDGIGLRVERIDTLEGDVYVSASAPSRVFAL
jgi:twitching motility protein PilT